MTSYRPVRGMRDIIGNDFWTFEYIIDTAKRIVQTYGFQGIETPIVEESHIFEKSLGETSDVVGKEMYTFLDKGGHHLTLRPEGTASIARAILSNNLLSPQKLFYHGPFFRYERPQKGRYRQFSQFSVEWTNGTSPHMDVEVILCAYTLLSSLNLTCILHIHTLADLKTRNLYKETLKEFFKNKDLSIESQGRLERNPLRILDSKDPNDIEICKQAPKLLDTISNESLEHFQIVCRGLKNRQIPFLVDHKLVRGLDYYVDTIFEFKTTNLGTQDTLLGGGRYDGLLGISNPSVGWSLGIDRTSLLINKSFKTFRVGIVYIDQLQAHYALDIACELRNAGVTAEISHQSSFSKRMKEHKHSDILVIVGEDEIKNQTVVLKKFDERTVVDRGLAVQSVLHQAFKC